MNMFKIIVFSMLLSLSLSFVGCQGDNSDGTSSTIPETNTTTPPDTNTTLPPVDVNATTDIKNLAIINGNRLTITGGKTTKDIFIMGFNSSGSTNVKGSVTFQYPSEFINNNINYGIINPGTATMVDGRVQFTYTSPDDITDINGTTAQFFFYDTTNADANVSLFIDFNLTGNVVSTDPILKTLVLSDDNLSVYSNSQSESLLLQAYTDQSTININATLDVKYPANIITNGIDIGSLPSTINVVNGKASFSYTGPVDVAKTISDLASAGISNPITINTYDKVTGSNVDLFLYFITKTADPKYTTYNLKVFPESNITITTASQSVVVEAYLEDNATNKPVSGEDVIIDFFDSSKGTMSSFNGTTDVSGHIVFNYTAPSDINIADINITVKLNGDVSNKIDVPVFFDTTTIDPKYNNYALKILPENNLTIITVGESKVIDVYLSDTNANAPVSNETISLDFFAGDKGIVNTFSATTDVTGHVVFNYTAPNDINISDFNLTVRVTADQNNTVTTKIIFNEVVIDPKYTQYDLQVYPNSVDTNVSITANGQSSVIEAYLEDNATNLPVAGESIIAEFFDATKGTLSSFSATTDANGHVAFNYTAPADIANANDFNITFKLSADVTNSKYATIDFTAPPALDPKYSTYTITAVSASTNITAPLQSKIIDVYLEDNTATPAANEVILVKYFAGDKGSLDAFSKTTDANGHAAFVYTSPANVTLGDDYNLSFRLEQNTSNDSNITLTVVTASGSANYNDYNLTLVDTNRTITAVNQQETFSLFLENNGTAVANEVVLLDFFNGVKGTVDAFSGTTDTNGKVDFIYTAPSNLTDLNNTTLHFTLENNITKEVNATILVDVNAPAKDYTNYILSIVDANRTITTSSQIEVFNLFLKNNTTNTPASGDTITVDFFDGTKGVMDTFSTTTDANGKAVFTYTAPVSLTDLNDTNITFRIQNTTDSNNSVVSNLQVSAATTEAPNLSLGSSTMTVTKNAEAVAVKVLIFYSNGLPYNSGSIVVTYPQEIVDGNVSGGKFSESEVVISNGEAIFNFVGSDPVKSIGDLDFVFSYKTNTDANTTLTIKYNPDVPQLVFDDSNITVTTNGETVAIGVNVYDSNNAPYPDGNIKIIYPNDVLTGKDVGSFDASTVAVVNGKANFVYTAANPLDVNDTLVFQFYHDAQALLSEANLTVNIIPDPNQVVLTNYTLEAIYDTSINLETTKQMTFSVKDDTNTSIADSNITSLRVTVLNSALGTLEDTAGNTNTTLTVSSKNDVPMNIKSKTISGVIPVEVLVQFKDANNADKNLTKVFNVVVLSGPPTAMSLSYASTDQNSSSAKFIENWVLTVTDKYNNLVDSNPAISTGLITGYAQSSATTGNAGNYLYFDTASGGTLTEASPANDTFTSTAEVFRDIDLVNDKLVLFGTGFHFDAFGKWDIATLDSNTTLSLVDDFNGTTTGSLGYAVGNNFRNETCSGSSVVANVYAKDGNNILPNGGSMIIQVEYDYYLTGKSIMLWTNLVGEHNNTIVKIGTAKKVTLRGQGLTSETYSFAKGHTGVTRLNISITNTPEFYKNANYAYAIEVSGDANWTESNNSMVGGITSCVNSGIGFVDINFTSPSNEAGTVTLTNLVPSSEF